MCTFPMNTHDMNSANRQIAIFIDLWEKKNQTLLGPQSYQNGKFEQVLCHKKFAKTEEERYFENVEFKLKYRNLV